MTLEEINIEIEKIELAIFHEQMADFMNWERYHKLNNELRELKHKREELLHGV